MAREGQEDNRRTRGGQEEDKRRRKRRRKRRTSEGHRVGQRGQRTTEGQDPDTELRHRVQGHDQPVWPALFFLRENPNSKLFEEKSENHSSQAKERQLDCFLGTPSIEIEGSTRMCSTEFRMPWFRASLHRTSLLHRRLMG